MRGIGNILEERANLIQENRRILDTAEEEGRDLSAEEAQEYDRRDARIEELTESYRRWQRAQEHEELDIRATLGEEPSESETAERSIDSDEYRSALLAYVRGEELTAEQRSTLNVGTDGEGGYAVPEFWSALYEGLREFGAIRGAATVITTEMGGPLHVPRVSAAATAPGIVDEEGAIPDDAESFDELVLNAYKYARITKASEEVIQDALFDVPSFVGRRLGQDLALATGAAYAVGSGSDEPEGLFTGANSAGSVDLSAQDETTISDALIDLVYSVPAPYRVDGRWVLNDQTIARVRKLKDANDQYIWQPGLQAGQPDRLLGYPVLSDPHVPTPSGDPGDPVIGFGNIARAFTIRDVLGVTIKFLDQLYAANDQVGWRGKLRTDSGVVDANAFKTLVIAGGSGSGSGA